MPQIEMITLFLLWLESEDCLDKWIFEIKKSPYPDDLLPYFFKGLDDCLSTPSGKFIYNAFHWPDSIYGTSFWQDKHFEWVEFINQ
jgi:hypothetical protein